ALAILEKYATNLLKPMKPINWRTVKFTSSLVRTYLENIEGSTDILRQMGYTANVQDGLSFPDNIIEPNVEKVRELAADLYLARVEIGDLVKGKHPYFVIIKLQQIQREHESRDSGSDYEDALDNIPPGSPRPSSAQEAKPDKAAAPSSPCFICGEDKVELTCKDCAEDFCRSCDGVFHRNPARTSHTRMKLGGGKRPIPTPRKRSVKEPPNKPSPQSTANALIETRSLSNILAPNRAVFFPPSYQTSSLNDEEEHIYVSPRAFLDSENPPPLPPKTTKSKPVRRQLSCPNCHCMNMENSKACKVCHQPLTERDTFFPKANDAKEKQPGHTSVPKTVKEQWQCEYCTFLNSLTVKICDMCFKTRTANAKLTPQTTYTQRTAQGLPSYPTLPPPPPPPPQTTPFGYSSASHETQNPIRTDLWREREEMLIEGRRYVDLLKTAEINNFLPEELNIAITLSEGMEMGPIEWLKTKWFDLIHTVMLRVTEKSKCADIGNISPEEARQALIEHTGDVEPAVEYCVTQRENKLTKVMDSGIYVRTDCIKELDKSNGDVDRAIRSLELLTLAPFRQRILERCRPVEGEGEAAPCPPSRQRRVRVMLAQKSMLSWGRALTAIKLIDENFAVEDSIIAAQDNGDLERSKKFLQRECIVCMDLKPENRMITMLNCQCRFCSDCVSQYVKQIIQEQNIMHLVCPACSEPKNLEDDTVATNYFNLLDILIRPLVDNPTHDLFQRKLRDRTLMKEPNFRWCSHCSSGFINERPGILKMPCPHCHKYTCFQCKKQWEDQHEGISCEQFAAWKEANDPEAQATGLAAHLKQNGIECPNCKFRYDLAKGGCMHFKCGQCSHEYCSGCYGPFRHGAHCPVSPHCAMRGLHAHHPRDCLFYLRDRDPEELQQLLAENNVAFDTEEGAAAAPGHCRVMEQAEAGTEDKECGRPTPDGYAGLCRMHYIEYLVERVNANLIDPVSIMTSDQLKLALEREDQAVPQKKETENNKNFRARLVQ
ncbi:predicted protein, partial [Nematostella vectensis]